MATSDNVLKPPKMFPGKCQECLWGWFAPKGTGCPNDNCKFFNTRKAASALGRRKSKKKAEASRENGKKGGRPKIIRTKTAKHV